MGMVTSAPEITSTHLEQKFLVWEEDLCTRYPFCTHPAGEVPQELQETRLRRGHGVRAGNPGTKLNQPESSKLGRRLDTKPGCRVIGAKVHGSPSVLHLLLVLENIPTFPALEL